MVMRIVYYLCGYQSHSQHSPKFHYLQQHAQQKIRILPLDYPDTYDPAICLPYFMNHIGQQRVDGFIGSSLGGFWALILANHYRKGALLLNPCCQPTQFAAQFPQQQAIFAGFSQLESTPLHSALPRLAILAKNDTVLDYRQTMQQLPESTQIIVYNEGGHLLHQQMPLIAVETERFFTAIPC